MSRPVRNFFFISAAVGGLLTLMLLVRLFSTFQDRLIDRLFVPALPPSNIVIVEIDEKSISSIGQWPWPRAVFASVINQLQSTAVIGIDVNFKESSHVGPDDDERLVRALAASRVPIVLTADVQPDGSISPLLPLFEKSSIQGFPNLLIAPDDVARHIQFTRNNISSFSLQAATAYANANHLPALSIPDRPVRIEYRGPQGTFNSVRLIDVLNRAIPDNFFQNKIVLIGATARDLQDYHHTPLGIVSGVEIQANIIATLLGQQFFHQDRWVTVASIWLLTLIVVALSLRVRHLAILIAGIVACLTLYNVAAFISFDHHYILDLLYPNLAIVLGAGLAISNQYFHVSRERKFIQETFARYLAPQVITELLRDPSQLKLGGAKRTLTILFSDIRGFTTISESLEPEQLTKFLNDYLTVMTDVILAHDGLVDKYIGDAIMAFWGAPVPNEQHVRDAVTTAVAMIDALHQFNKRHEGSGLPPINIGIGINTGDVTVGNMGSEKRFDFTVMGDSVNLASRLESLSKTYGVNIIIGQQTHESLPAEMFLTRELDRVQVKGKKNAVHIYEIVPTYYQEKVKSILDQFNQGRELYYAAHWAEANKIFKQILEKTPDDGPTKILSERCQEFQLHPPESWQGVYEHTHK